MVSLCLYSPPMYPYYAGFHTGEKWPKNPKRGFLTGREVEQAAWPSTLEYRPPPFLRRFPSHSVTVPFLVLACSLLIPRWFPCYSVASPFSFRVGSLLLPHLVSTSHYADWACQNTCGLKEFVYCAVLYHVAW